MDRKLVYRRTSAIKEIEAERTKRETVASSEVAPIPSGQIPSAYRKEEGRLSYSLMCVISGGTERERSFLNELERKHTFRGLDVIFVSTGKGCGGLTPKMMQAAYESICKDGVINIAGRTVRLESVDVVYMFTDVDHYETELKEILSMKKDASPVWIISNPDFEIWLYYCYRNNPYEELRAVVEEKETGRSSALKTINGTFNNWGGLDTRKAFEHLKDGIAHSKEHYRETDGIPNLLSTRMYVFAEDVLMRLGDEYDEFVRRKQAFREKMRLK